MSLQDEQSMGESLLGGGLYGRFDYTLDAKKRFSIPADWREAMGSPVYVYVMPDPGKQCLHLLPPEEMKRNFDMLRHRELFDEDLDEVMGIIGENVDQVRLDVQGRIRVSDQLLAYAMIEDTVVMVGTQTRAQLWSLKLRPAVATVDKTAFSEACDAYKVCKSRMLSRKR